MISKIKNLITSLLDLSKLQQKIPALAKLNLEQLKGGMGAQPGSPASERAMKFPYTFSAKVAHFPYKFYYQNNWIWRHYPYAVALCIPVFAFCSKLSNTPNNKKVWAEIRAKDANPHHGEEYLMLEEEENNKNNIVLVQDSDGHTAMVIEDDEKCGCDCEN